MRGKAKPQLEREILPPTWRLIPVQPTWPEPDYYCESPNREGWRTPVVMSARLAIQLARKIDAEFLDGLREQ